MPCHCLIMVEVMNMVTYEKLWETMKSKNITQYRLISIMVSAPARLAV